MTYIPTSLNGPSLSTQSNAVATPVNTITGAAKTTPALNYEFLTDTTNGWLDTLGYNWFSFTVTTAGAGTTGVLSFETTNDTASAPSGSPLIVQDTSVTTLTRISTLTLSATATRQFEAALPARYVRIRVSTAVPSGTVAISANFRQNSAGFTNTDSLILTGSLPAGSTKLGNVNSNGSAIFLGTSQTYGSQIIDINANTVTTSSSSVLYNINETTSCSFSVNITALSGISAAQDLVIQESPDGTNWVDLYAFERMTALGTLQSPILRLSGQYIRYIRNVSGTGPSITSTISRAYKSSDGMLYRSWFDRAVDPTVNGSSTTVFNVNGCSQLTIVIASNSAGSPCTIAFQGSDDKQNWWTFSNVATVSNQAVSYNSTSLSAAVAAKWVRAYVSTPGTSQTLLYIHFIGIGTS